MIPNLLPLYPNHIPSHINRLKSLSFLGKNTCSAAFPWVFRPPCCRGPPQVITWPSTFTAAKAPAVTCRSKTCSLSWSFTVSKRTPGRTSSSHCFRGWMSLRSMDWFRKSKPETIDYWRSWGCPVTFPLNQSVHRGNISSSMMMTLIYSMNHKNISITLEKWKKQVTIEESSSVFLVPSICTNLETNHGNLQDLQIIIWNIKMDKIKKNTVIDKLSSETNYFGIVAP